jgi:probable rRNA maturation factor
MPKESISFFSQKILFKLSHPVITANWLTRISRKENRPIKSLTYVFCSDAYLQALNKKYLHHNSYTDILTFDYSEKTDLEGEIFISIPRVRENARKYGEPFERELKRVMAHGLLHLLGFNDKNRADKAQMRRKEEACLSLWD